MVFDSPARIDLVEHYVVEMTTSVYVRADLEALNAIWVNDSDSGMVLRRYTPYSRRKQPLAIFEGVFRHQEELDRFLVEIVYRQDPKSRPSSVRKIVDGITLGQFLSSVIEIEASSVAIEFGIPPENKMARRLPFVFPILQDASTMYPVRPAQLPVDEISGLMGLKHSSDDDVPEYTIAVSKMSDEVQIILGFALKDLDLEEDLGATSLIQSNEQLRRIGLLTP